MNSQAASEAKSKDGRLNSHRTISLVNSSANCEMGSSSLGRDIAAQQGSSTEQAAQLIPQAQLQEQVSQPGT